MGVFYIFFFQAEDGIRDDLVTGVQTCALPILIMSRVMGFPSVAIQIELFSISIISTQIQFLVAPKIGRASCRERV